MDNADFQKKYKQIIRKHTACGALAVVLYILAYARFVSAAWRGYGELVLLGLVLVTSWYLVRRSNREINAFLGPCAESVFAESFALERYEPNGHVPRKDCRASRLFTKDYGFSLLDLSGSGLVVGRYRGIPFRFSDLALSKGRFSRIRSAAFCSFEHPGTVDGRILIKSVREPWYANRTASGGFQERFRVTGNDREDTARVLTAELKRRLVQLDRTARADEAGHRRMDISIDAERVYIVLWNKKGLFGTRYQSVGELRSAAGEDVRWISACMDAFLDQPALTDMVLEKKE